MEHTHRQAYTHSIIKVMHMHNTWFVHDCSHCTEGLLRDLTHTQTLIHMLEVSRRPNINIIAHPCIIVK